MTKLSGGTVTLWEDEGEPRIRGGKACRQDDLLFGNEVATEVALDGSNRPSDDGAVGGFLSKIEVLKEKRKSVYLSRRK